jgi:hypothetical protein
MLGGVTAAGLSKGAQAAQYLASPQLELLLNTVSNNLFAVKAGDVILGLDFVCHTAAGAACTVDVGLDAAAIGGVADVDALAVDFDANAAGETRSGGTAALYRHGFVVAADGYVTIQSSADEHASAFVGTIAMRYIPA